MWGEEGVVCVRGVRAEGRGSVCVQGGGVCVQGGSRGIVCVCVHVCMQRGYIMCDYS